MYLHITNHTALNPYSEQFTRQKKRAKWIPVEKRDTAITKVSKTGAEKVKDVNKKRYKQSGQSA